MATTTTSGFWVGRDADRYGEHHNLGIGILSFKVLPQDSQGDLLVVELVHHAKGGPPRHLHRAQDEVFYVVEGEYLVEVGQERFRLRPGDCAFGPRAVPHTWAFVGEHTGRIIFTVSPAGRMEPFLRELSRMGAAAPQITAFWPPFDLDLVGPPLAIE
ncbi:MAG: cupin domain-containing protein [Thermomicrobiales bacterium]